MTVGLCFLVYDGVQHPEVWDRFFAEGKTRRHEHFEVVSHIKTPTAATPRWLQDGRVPSVRTGHCEYGLVTAHLELVRRCLELGCTHCLLISQACVPLWTRDDLLARVRRARKSRFCTVSGHEYRASGGLAEDDPEVAASVLKLKASQWSLLTREVMEAYLTLALDTQAVRAFRRQATLVLKRTGLCADEYVPLSYLLHTLGGGDEATLRRYVDYPAPVTFVHWYAANGISPTPMTAPTAEAVVRKIKRSGADWLLARKVYKSAVGVVAFCLSEHARRPRRPRRRSPPALAAAA